MQDDAAHVAAPFVVGAVLDLFAAWLNTGGRLRRIIGVAIPLLVMGGEGWLVPRPELFARCAAVLFTFIGVMRAVDVARTSFPLGRRILHAMSVVDSRRLTYVGAGLDRRNLITGLLWNTLAWPMWFLIPTADRFTGAAHWAVRWSFALVFIFAVSEGAYPLLRVVYRAIGFLTPPLHIAPGIARSVQEFWGERWNRTVSGWLGDTFFRPLARRRRPLLGAFLAFVMSAVLHAYLVLVNVPWSQTLVMFGFFVAQAVVIGLERLLRTRAWSPSAGHVWTITWMAGLSPLFSEPGLRALGV